MLVALHYLHFAVRECAFVWLCSYVLSSLYQGLYVSPTLNAGLVAL